MRHAWRWFARWLGSPSGWPAAEPWRARPAVLRAFADRSVVDWTAALRYARSPRERDVVDALRRLDGLRGATPRVQQRTADIRAWPVAIATALASAQIIAVLTLAAAAIAAGAPPADAGVPLSFVVTFSAAGVLLCAPAVRDDRAFLLLAIFALTGSAFAHAAIVAMPFAGPVRSSPLFRGVYPDIFAAAVVWELAVVFPAVHRFTSLDMLARRVTSGAWILAACLWAANVALVIGPAALPVDVLKRNHVDYLYWKLFAAVALPAIAAILLRAHRATRREQQKVTRFAFTIAAGAGPFLVLGVARSLPVIDAWVRSAAIRTWMDPLVLVPLGALPVCASIAVLVDRPFAHSRIDWQAGSTWQRATGRLARRLRRRKVHVHLSEALERIRLARGSRELSMLLCGDIERGTSATRVETIEPEALPAHTALVSLMRDSPGPVDLARDGEPFVLLPRQDRDWLDARGIGLLVPVRLRDETIAAIVLAGTSRPDDPFDPTDLWLIGALTAAASAAWPPTDDRAGESADECGRCGLVRSPAEVPCCPGAPVTLAPLPSRLAEKYVVVRRLGSGGMGIVYLGRDLALGRDVALKTLPGLGAGVVPRLNDEARVMAALHHPAIATIYGVETWHRTPVLVLEYCPGGTLADASAHCRLSPDDVVRLGIRLAEALSYIHARGVLHRDVKPSNIGFAEDGTAKLLDFGLAVAGDLPAGTRAYLPPEALDGAPPDRHVDLWGLAVSLREACGGNERLREFFERALAPRPSDRYGSGDEMARELTRLLQTH